MDVLIAEVNCITYWPTILQVYKLFLKIWNVLWSIWGRREVCFPRHWICIYKLSTSLGFLSTFLYIFFFRFWILCIIVKLETWYSDLMLRKFDCDWHSGLKPCCDRAVIWRNVHSDGNCFEVHNKLGSWD